ncbi:MAG: hypothetical protein LBS89_06755 [Zoogloeaceae bacterium]|jgi:hypothetical protein|nr:hypothetical protein [Zoogloeaceae bacterium]
MHTRSQIHSPSRQRQSRNDRDDLSWQTHLPPEWRSQVDPPLELRHYQDYEMEASRVVGYDADDKPCYTAYRFSLLEPRSDDGEEFYTVLAYGESLAAWRLRDERWLIWREIRTEEDCAQARSFYSLAQEMPR